METIQSQDVKLQEIIKDVDCEKDFACLKSDLNQVSKVKIPEEGSFLECQKQHNETCSFSLPCDDKVFCLCPVRIYIAKKWKT